MNSKITPDWIKGQIKGVKHTIWSVEKLWEFEYDQVMKGLS